MEGAVLTFKSPHLGRGMGTQVLFTGKGEDKLRSWAGLPSSEPKDQRLHDPVPATPASRWTLGGALEGLKRAEAVSSLELSGPQPPHSPGLQSRALWAQAQPA